MNWFKWLLAVVASLIAVVAFYLLVLFDLNDYKVEITDKIEQQTGRQLQIAGDISWTLYPVLGLSLTDVKLSNPKGFVPEQMLEITELTAAVALMPLFNQQVNIQQLYLNGVTVNLVSRKDGSSSLDGLMAEHSTTAAPENADNSALKPQQLQLKDVSIFALQLNLFNEASPARSFAVKSLKLTDFQPEQWAPLQFEIELLSDQTRLDVKGSALLQLSQNNQLVQLKDFRLGTDFSGLPIKQLALQSTLTLALDKKQLQWQWQKLQLDQINGAGQLSLDYAKRPVIKLDLQLDEVDSALYIPEANTAQQNSAGQVSTTEPDLSVLRGFDLDAKLAVKRFKAAGLHTENLQVALSNKAGLVQIQNASADLYQGKVQAKATVDAGKTPVSYSFNKQLSGLALRPLLMDGADIDLLSGTAKLTIEGKGHSLLPDQIKKNLLATGSFEITDGSLYGVNIAQMIRNAKSTFKNEADDTAATEQKTDFSSLTGSFNLTDGVLTNPDLKMAAPLLRLAGKGSANLLTEALDYQLSTALVNTSKGQGGKEKDELAGVEIPLKISGTLQKPKYALDTKALFETQLKDKVDSQKEKLKNKLLEKLGGG